MVAPTQYRLMADDLAIVLALFRCPSLAQAGARLNLDASTVFRRLQRIERGIGAPLFERTRQGYQPLELAHVLAAQAERVETALEASQSAAQLMPQRVSGTVRITTTDTILHGLVAPALPALHSKHPLLQFEMHTGNTLANLVRRDADIAVRATRRPPAHLIGRPLGVLRVALYARSDSPWATADVTNVAEAPWIAPDAALPEHPSVQWRLKMYPGVVPTYQVSSILTVAELVALGLGVGVLPLFLARARQDLVQLTEPLDDAESELWLLTHSESRHLRRVSTVYAHLAGAIEVD